MKTSLTKSVLLSTSLLTALVALSSCGKSKDLKSNPPAVTVQTTQAPPPAQVGGPTAPPVTVAPQTIPTSPTASNPTAPTTPAATLDPDAQPIPQAPVGQTTLPTPDQQLNPNRMSSDTSSAPKALKAYQVNFAGQAAVRTGGVSSDLFYTSVGDDGLMEEFKNYNSKVSAAQQVMNANLAKAITVARLTRVSSVGDMSINLSINEFGVVQTYRLTAANDGDKMKLSLSTKGTTGEMDFQGGFLKCLDSDGSCDTAYAKIKMAGGYARIIFRNSYADLHFLLQEDVSNNSGFSLLSKYILNAANALGTPERIEAMQLSSFEIINGRAATGALITTGDNEVIGLSIPMVVSAKDSMVNSLATKVSDLSKSYDLSSSGATTLSQKINSVKIVNNNGRGHFKLQLQMGTESQPASIWIIVARVQKQTMTLNEVRNFESKLKAF